MAAAIAQFRRAPSQHQLADATNKLGRQQQRPQQLACNAASNQRQRGDCAGEPSSGARGALPAFRSGDQVRPPKALRLPRPVALPSIKRAAAGKHCATPPLAAEKAPHKTEQAASVSNAPPPQQQQQALRSSPQTRTAQAHTQPLVQLETTSKGPAERTLPYRPSANPCVLERAVSRLDLRANLSRQPQQERPTTTTTDELASAPELSKKNDLHQPTRRVLSRRAHLTSEERGLKRVSLSKREAWKSSASALLVGATSSSASNSFGKLSVANVNVRAPIFCAKASQAISRSRLGYFAESEVQLNTLAAAAPIESASVRAAKLWRHGKALDHKITLEQATRQSQVRARLLAAKGAGPGARVSPAGLVGGVTSRSRALTPSSVCTGVTIALKPKQKQQQQPTPVAVAAVTNSRLRQGALFARRQLQLMPITSAIIGSCHKVHASIETSQQHRQSNATSGCNQSAARRRPSCAHQQSIEGLPIAIQRSQRQAPAAVGLTSSNQTDFKTRDAAATGRQRGAFWTTGPAAASTKERSLTSSSSSLSLDAVKIIKRPRKQLIKDDTQLVSIAPRASATASLQAETKTAVETVAVSEATTLNEANPSAGSSLDSARDLIASRAGAARRRWSSLESCNNDESLPSSCSSLVLSNTSSSNLASPVNYLAGAGDCVKGPAAGLACGWDCEPNQQGRRPRQCRSRSRRRSSSPPQLEPERRLPQPFRCEGAAAAERSLSSDNGVGGRSSCGTRKQAPAAQRSSQTASPNKNNTNSEDAAANAKQANQMNPAANDNQPPNSDLENACICDNQSATSIISCSGAGDILLEPDNQQVSSEQVNNKVVALRQEQPVAQPDNYYCLPCSQADRSCDNSRCASIQVNQTISELPISESGGDVIHCLVGSCESKSDCKELRGEKSLENYLQTKAAIRQQLVQNDQIISIDSGKQQAETTTTVADMATFNQMVSRRKRDPSPEFDHCNAIRRRQSLVEMPKGKKESVYNVCDRMAKQILDLQPTEQSLSRDDAMIPLDTHNNENNNTLDQFSDHVPNDLQDSINLELSDIKKLVGRAPAVASQPLRPNQSINIEQTVGVTMVDTNTNLDPVTPQPHLDTSPEETLLTTDTATTDTDLKQQAVDLCLQEEANTICIMTTPISDRYDLETRPFARGKFAQVKRCVKRETKECFAAKCIKKRSRLVDFNHENLLEIEVLKLSYHTSYIVKLYEVYETTNEMILILEMANGGELQRVLDEEEAIDESLVRKMIRQILEGLICLHDNQIAHLDIKPQNLLLTKPFPNGDIKLCDFGISRRITKGSEIRDICGTPDYCAPEILRYDPISLMTDMWSLGVLTYVLLTGYSPFGSLSKQQTFCNITTCALDFPAEIFEKVSKDAQDFIAKLIILEPDKRLSSRQAIEHHWIKQ